MSEQRDIIERLRDRAGYWHSMLRDEAADEIASLRAQIAEAQEALEEEQANAARAWRAWETLKEQLASARKALEPFVDAMRGVPDDYVDGRPFASVPNDMRCAGTMTTIRYGQVRALISALTDELREVEK